MTATTPPRGNNIVPTPSGGVPFPMLALGAVVVGTGVYLVSQQSDMAGWVFVFLLLLAIAYAQRSFGSELNAILSGN